MYIKHGLMSPWTNVMAVIGAGIAIAAHFIASKFRNTGKSRASFKGLNLPSDKHSDKYFKGTDEKLDKASNKFFEGIDESSDEFSNNYVNGINWNSAENRNRVLEQKIRTTLALTSMRSSDLSGKEENVRRFDGHWSMNKNGMWDLNSTNFDVRSSYTSLR